MVFFYTVRFILLCLALATFLSFAATYRQGMIPNYSFVNFLLPPLSYIDLHFPRYVLSARATKHLYYPDIDLFLLSIALLGFFCFSGVLSNFSILLSLCLFFVRMSHDWHNLLFVSFIYCHWRVWSDGVGVGTYGWDWNMKYRTRRSVMESFCSFY